MAFDDHFIDELRGIVGGPNVLTDDELTIGFRTDWTGRFSAGSAVVARPATTGEVAEIVARCVANEVAIVPQGGNTGLVGGSVPLSGELVLSTARMRGIESLDGDSGGMTAMAGTLLAEVRDEARAAGWAYGVDIASRDSATIGGTVATNAGGLRVVRHGDTRRQVVGVEMVAGTGEVISELGGTLRNNTGYNIPSLVSGSEGTLGVITRVRLRLVPESHMRTTALVRFDHPGDAARSAERIRGLLADIESIELFFASGLELVCSVFGLRPPFNTVDGGYLLLEAVGTDDPTEHLGEVVSALDGVSEVAVAADHATSEKLWRYRELHTEAIATVGTAHKLDVAVPPGSLEAFTSGVGELVAGVAPRAQTWLFGHGGESAVHVNVTGVDSSDYTVDEAVLRFVADLDGSISAEHGIGRAKLGWVGLAHSVVDLDVIRRIKDAFDPAGIMNPDVLVPRR